MAVSEPIAIPCNLPPDEAKALARLLGRLEPEDCARFAGPCTNYGTMPEAEVMWSGVLTLQGALAGAGFVVREG